MNHRALSLVTFAKTRRGLFFVCRNGDFLAAFGSAQRKHGAPRGGFHAGAKSVGADAALVVRLECTFHDSQTPVVDNASDFRLLDILSRVKEGNVPETL